MPAPTVTVLAPPPLKYFDPGLVRPQSLVRWTGGVGPFDVLHEWDTDSLFGAPIQDLNVGASSPDTGTPPSDLGPPGTPWHYRVRVTDTSDATFTVSAVYELTAGDPVTFRRYLYQLANVGVGFDPTDATGAGWGPAPAAIGPDGFAIAFRRFLHQLANVGVGFTPQDDPAGGWGPAPEAIGPDGDNRAFRRFLHQLANVGVGFDPIDGTAWGPAGAPGDGFAIAFRRYLYQLANLDETTPTPHIWYVFPTFGREGWEFRIVGYGFGDTQGTFSGFATLNGLAVGIITWELVAESDPDLVIDPLANIATPVHQLIRASVPTGASSGLVVVTTDGP